MDDTKSNEEKDKKCLHDRLFLTCGYNAIWIKNVLGKCEIKARIVAAFTLDTLNAYDNGHTLLEIYYNEFGWTLFDMDMHCRFELNEERLNIMELCEAIENHKIYKIVEIGNGSSLDVGNFRDKEGYSYSFLMEKILSVFYIKKWHKRIFQVAMICDEFEGKYYFFENKDINAVKKYSKSYSYIEKEIFVKKFYTK